MNKIRILGIDIDIITKEAVMNKISVFCSQKTGQHYIVTPNPEIILGAQKDEELFYILSRADLAIPDGVGVKLAGWFDRVNLERITGADLTAEILVWAEISGRRVGILIWNKGWSRRKEVEKAVRAKYPKLDFIVEEISRQEDVSLKNNFLAFSPEIIFVALGSPWQEKFLYHQLKNIPSAKVGLGIGGTFDYLTGKKKRAPKFLRLIGLEWIWRLGVQPNRGRRIWNATAVFAAKFLKSKYINPFFYRLSIACILYKKETKDNKNFKYKIFVVERQDWPGHWQLPQGGTDGENPMAAGERELKEELNTNKFVPKRIFQNIYRYRFSSNRQEPKIIQRHLSYKGQKQGLFIAEFTGCDEDIKLNFWDHSAWKWIEADKLVGEVYAIRKRAAQIFLKKFKEFVK